MRKDEVINKLYKEINHPPLSYDLSIVLNNTDSNISNILNIKSYKNITDENLNLHTINLIFNSNCEYIPFENIINNTPKLTDIDIILKNTIDNIFNKLNFYSNFSISYSFLTRNNTWNNRKGFINSFYNYNQRVKNFNTVYGTYLGNGSNIFHKEKNKILYLFVVKKEYVNYIRKCLLLRQVIDFRVFELWVDDEFDVTNSYFKNFRPFYRKIIKKPFLEAGGKIVVKNNILNNYFKTFYLKDDCSNILELKKNKKLLKETILKN